MADKISYTDACVQGGLPPCTCACPVNFNPRVFFAKLKKGNFNAAYREYANSVIFPGIVSRICQQPCLNSCPEKVSLLELERACVAYADNKNPISFNLPPRKGSIAIIGAGLSGLACANKLATRKFAVTVFEASGKIGGNLSRIMDEEIYMEELERQFKHLKYTLETNRTISSLNGLEFDAIYIATGEGGNDFGLLEGWNKATKGTRCKGIFLGGRLTGGSDMKALMDGIIAAASIENYLRTGSMDGQEESFLREECTLPLKDSCFCEIRVPADGERYSREEAVAEANRCIDCDCTVCKDTCEFLKHMDMFPRRVEADAGKAAASQRGMLETVGTRMIVSCSVCGHCGSVCPKNINVEDILIKSKRKLYQMGNFAPPLHDFYLRDMAMVLNEAYLAKATPGQETASYLFFPGCQMTASGMEHVEKVYQYLLDKQPATGLMMACCGVPALWAGNHELMDEVFAQIKGDWERLGKPKLILACATCVKTFTAYWPEVEWISLYEFICQNGLPADASALEGEWSVFDPCASRNFSPMQKAVRELALKMGAQLKELPDSRYQARCCGMGGHIYPANPAIFEKMVATAIGQSELPYLTYCTNCRNVFLSAGKKNQHILDGVFGVEPLAKPFHISNLRKNRLNLKKKLLNHLWGEDLEIMEKQYTVKLTIPEEIYEKMDKFHISEEDVYEVVEHCEQTNETVLDTETGILTGHLQIGIITYWVQYKKAAGALTVTNVYSHRLKFS